MVGFVVWLVLLCGWFFCVCSCCGVVLVVCLVRASVCCDIAVSSRCLRRLGVLQMRKWCLEQQREREERLAAEKTSDKEYAAYLESLGVMRDGFEAKLKAERAAQAAAIKATNDRMVRECVCMCVHTCACMCACMCVPVCACVSMCVSMCVSICVLS